jgi:hypothetical protein
VTIVTRPGRPALDIVVEEALAYPVAFASGLIIDSIK